ncbi:hypothetical protein M3Y99_00705400 [Aphelenchoides fujianensis]|nr:hypothetical protein M3Y99_00705400 [Aphelenchoides fujianensis]
MHKSKSSRKIGHKAKDPKGRASNRNGKQQKKPADATAERKEDAAEPPKEEEVLHLSDIEQPLVEKPDQKPAEEPKKTPEVPLEPPTTPPAAPFAASKPNASKSTTKAVRVSPKTLFVRNINEFLRSRPPTEDVEKPKPPEDADKPKPLAIEGVGEEANTKEVGAEAVEEAGGPEKDGGVKEDGQETEKNGKEAKAAVPEAEVPETTSQKSDEPAAEVAEPPPAAKPNDGEPPAGKAERPNDAKVAEAKGGTPKRKSKSNADHEVVEFLRTDMPRFFRPDLTIRVRNREFTISKQQMARHSNYFARLTFGGLYLKEASGKPMETEDVVTERSTQNEHIVELLVECVRNGGVVPAAVARGSTRELVELAFMARKWEIGSIVSTCERELIKTTTAKNVHERLVIGRMLRFERLLQYAQELFARNKPPGFRAEDEKCLANYADSFAIKELLLHTNAFR